MNLFKAQDMLKNLSDDQLDQQMRNPSGSVPPFMVMAELDRRSEVRKEFSRAHGVPETTVLDDMIDGKLQSPASTYDSGMPTPPVDNQMGMPPAQINPMMQQDMMQQGNAQAGIPQAFANGGYVDPLQVNPLGLRPVYSPAEARSLMGRDQSMFESFIDSLYKRRATRLGEAYPNTGEILSEAQRKMPHVSIGGDVSTDQPPSRLRGEDSTIVGSSRERLGPSGYSIPEVGNLPRVPAAAYPVSTLSSLGGDRGLGALPAPIGPPTQLQPQININKEQKPAIDYFSETMKTLRDLSANRPDPTLEYDRMLSELTSTNAEQLERERGMALAALGFGMASGTDRNFLTNMGKGFASAMPSVTRVGDISQAQKKELLGLREKRAVAEQARNEGDYSRAAKMANLYLQEKQMKAQEEYYKGRVEAAKARSMGTATKSDTYKKYETAVKTYQTALELNQKEEAAKALELMRMYESILRVEAGQENPWMTNRSAVDTLSTR